MSFLFVFLRPRIIPVPALVDFVSSLLFTSHSLVPCLVPSALQKNPGLGVPTRPMARFVRLDPSLFCSFVVVTSPFRVELFVCHVTIPFIGAARLPPVLVWLRSMMLCVSQGLARSRFLCVSRLMARSQCVCASPCVARSIDMCVSRKMARSGALCVSALMARSMDLCVSSSMARSRIMCVSERVARFRPHARGPGIPPGTGALRATPPSPASSHKGPSETP